MLLLVFILPAFEQVFSGAEELQQYKIKRILL